MFTALLPYITVLQQEVDVLNRTELAVHLGHSRDHKNACCGFFFGFFCSWLAMCSPQLFTGLLPKLPNALPCVGCSNNTQITIKNQAEMKLVTKLHLFGTGG